MTATPHSKLRGTMAVLLALILLAGFTACGQKGGLTRPDEASLAQLQ